MPNTKSVDRGGRGRGWGGIGRPCGASGGGGGGARGGGARRGGARGAGAGKEDQCRHVRGSCDRILKVVVVRHIDAYYQRNYYEN